MYNPAPSESAEASAGRAAVAGRKPKAISASSFKLLTAKLKGASVPAELPVRSNIETEPSPPALIVAGPDVPGTDGGAPAGSKEPAVQEVHEATADPLATQAPPLPEFIAPLPVFPEPVPLQTAALPVFDTLRPSPVLPEPSWHDPLPPIDALFDPQPVETRAEEPVDTQAPVSTSEAPVAPQIADPEPEEAEQLGTALNATPPVEEPELAETPPEQEAAGELPTWEEPVQTLDVWVEPEPVLQSTVLQPELPASLAPEEARASEPEPTAAESPPELQELPQDAKAEQQETPEPKTRTSEMAGRVVDAMIKTISTAIYAKPSAAERAAFLREMAALMAEAANESDGSATGAVTPVPAAAVAPAPDPALPATVQPQQPQAAAQQIEDSRPVPAAVQDVPPAASPALPAQDPFKDLPPRAMDPRPPETPEADGESGELALTLLDMMSGGSSSLPHERTLAADTLLRILPRIPAKQLIAVVERVAIMETPPALLVARLIRDPRPEIVGPLLERCSQISDQDLMNAAPDHDTAKLRMIARRRTLSTVLSDYLIATGEPGVLLTVIRNPAAAFSHDAFFRLAEFASHHHALLAPLATRADLPPPVAFELFWHVPQELRRFIFSRFLTDSETLNKILRITLATHSADGSDEQAEAKFPTREALDEALSTISAFKLEAAAAKLADLARIGRDTAIRILQDREGEPLTVLLKALGCARARFEEVLHVLRQPEDGLLRVDRKPEELQAIFDSLSFNKARILLTYWDWYVKKSGPYAPQN